MNFRDESFMPDDDRAPVLAAGPETHFKPIKTIPVFSLHLLISTIISFTGIVLAMILPESKRCEAYFIMLYLRALFWLITLMIDHIVKHMHEKSRLSGYIDFHKATAMHRSVPFYIVTLWNNVIIVIQTLTQHYYGDNFTSHCIQGFLSPIAYITLFNVVETFFLFIVVGSYIARVYKFNNSGLPPDALNGNFNDNIGSVGVLHPHAHLVELIEKQADLISYLKDHNTNLNQKLIQLSTDLNILRGEMINREAE
ncbi:transmembrane protein 192 [Condylostylus longicornis]|uniref:transmembrane protein 192 n=1 Tax=Condylostylus longicornis TaxID=2530218 RepID=UPI00244DE88F|nr:transmembrane protein 192 [Condylostylus longicornis]XP_055377651.1 transmembrane protein 192 [Condylostylus longicornis]